VPPRQSSENPLSPLQSRNLDNNESSSTFPASSSCSHTGSNEPGTQKRFRELSSELVEDNEEGASKKARLGTEEQALEDVIKLNFKIFRFLCHFVLKCIFD